MGCFQSRDVREENKYSADPGTKTKEESTVQMDQLPPKTKTITKKEEFNFSKSDFVLSGKNINDSYFLITPAIGKGSYGEVRKAIHKATGLVRAVKMITKSAISEKDKENIMQEINILRKLVSTIFLCFSTFAHLKPIIFLLGSPKYHENLRILRR